MATANTTASAPAPAPAKTSKAAKPGATGPVKKGKVKKEKVARVEYPGLFKTVDGEETRQRLAEWPADFDAKAHKPLRRSDFTDETVFLNHKADALEAQAKALRDEAKTIASLGNATDRAKAKRLATMMKKIDELKASLVSEGVDLEALLAAAQANTQ